MSDAQQQAAPLAAAPEPAKRTKNPTYAVFAIDEHQNYVCMSMEVAASSRKEAIVACCKANSEPDREGDFLVIAAKEVKRLTRKIRRTVVDDFS